MKTTFTNMCMIYDDLGNVLVQNRVNPDWPGITFPGGHVEKDESFVDSVIREVFEETGLHISSVVLCGIKDWINEDQSRYVALLYKTKYYQGELKPSVEGDVFWINLKDKDKFQWAHDMQEMLAIFLRDDVSEFYYYQEDNQWKFDLK